MDVCGFSLGGRVALAIAATHPSLVRRLVARVCHVHLTSDCWRPRAPVPGGAGGAGGVGALSAVGQLAGAGMVHVRHHILARLPRSTRAPPRCVGAAFRGQQLHSRPAQHSDTDTRGAQVAPPPSGLSLLSHPLTCPLGLLHTLCRTPCISSVLCPPIASTRHVRVLVHFHRLTAFSSAHSSRLLGLSRSLRSPSAAVTTASPRPRCYLGCRADTQEMQGLAAIGGWDFKLLPGGHSLLLEQPALWQQHVITFLEDAPSPDTPSLR
jgi:pimeloyl-ACP methyl ester carboxylesterase